MELNKTLDPTNKINARGTVGFVVVIFEKFTLENNLKK